MPTAVRAAVGPPGLKTVSLNALLDLAIAGTAWVFLMIIGMFIWVLIQVVQHGKLLNPNPSVEALILISMPSLYLTIMGLWFWRGRKIRLKNSDHSNTKIALMGISAGVLICIMSSTMLWLMQTSGVKLEPSNQAIIEDISDQWPVLTVLLGAFIAPFFEELFFRQQLYGRFAAAGYTKTGLLFSSILFALMHELVPTQGIGKWLLGLCIYAALGAAFAWVYQKTGRLWPAVLAHVTNNFLALSALYISP
jgi:uncharacterized protein